MFLNYPDIASGRLSGMCCKLGLLVSLFSIVAIPTHILGQDFRWRSREAGLMSVSGTNGVALADYDRDGDPDIYFVVQASYEPNDPRTWNRLFSNRGDGTFLPATTSAALAGIDSSGAIFSPMGHKMGASWGDYNNDGWPDLYLTHLGPNQLLHNNGEGTFTEVTGQAGVAGGKTQLSSSALWFDCDLDGDLDLYVSNWEDYAQGPRDRGNRLYENLGNGEFLDISLASGLADKGATWTSIAMDVNNDGLLDVYLANDFGPNKFYLNKGDKTFQEKTAEFGLEDNYHGMGLAITDCDGNGYFDIYLTNITESGFDQEINPLFLNTGEDYFINSSVDAGVSLAGWGWGTEFLDLENDGDEDLFVATGYFLPEYDNVLFRNTSESGDFKFEKISPAVGLADSTVARGLAVFDYDRDGDPDLLISNFSQNPSLYQNPLVHGNWLDVKLEGSVSNRDAFGAVVEVWAGGRSYKKYHHGAQFLAQNILPLHFGLGNAQEVERITVRWPGGYTEEIGALEVNQTIHVKENEGVITGIRQSPDNKPVLPGALRLIGNYPNPFNGSTQIRFEIRVAGEVEVRIFNVQGQTVKVIREFFPAIGEKMIRWDATGWEAQPVSSGFYFYRIQIDHRIDSPVIGRMLYVK